MRKRLCLSMVCILCICCVACNKCPATTTATAVTTASVTTTTTSIDISADFMAFMDEYAAFMDDYVSFLKKYHEADDVLDLLAEYSMKSTKYAYYISKIESIDITKLSSADLEYYWKVIAYVEGKWSRLTLR